MAGTIHGIILGTTLGIIPGIVLGITQAGVGAIPIIGEGITGITDTTTIIIMGMPEINIPEVGVRIATVGVPLLEEGTWSLLAQEQLLDRVVMWYLQQGVPLVVVM